jgi:hypothetical protein
MNKKLIKDDHYIVGYFKELDENFDGRVSKDELLEAFDRLGISLEQEADEIMANMDSDGNGFIDYSELKIALAEWDVVIKEKNIAKVFKVEDGKLPIDAMRLELIDIKQAEWVRFLKDCQNDGRYMDLSSLKNYLRASVSHQV